MSTVAQLVGGDSLTQVSLVSRSMFSTTALRHPDICRDPCHSPLFPKRKDNCSLYFPGWPGFWAWSFYPRACMMVHFIGQCDQATECLDIQSHIIPGLSMWVFLDEVNIWVGRLKADCPPWCEWTSLNQLKLWIDQKAESIQVRKNSSCLTVLELRYRLFPVFGLRRKR